MLEKHDLDILWDSHVAANEASKLMSNMENCKTDLKARKLRSEIRVSLSEARRKMRLLKKYLQDKVAGKVLAVPYSLEADFKEKPYENNTDILS